MAYAQACEQLHSSQYHWLVTGVAGFIGSHLLERLLNMGQCVTGLDNFMTGHRHNLEQVRTRVSEQAWKNFRFIEGDIRVMDDCERACKDVDYVLHQAALGSVTRSIENPLLSCEVNLGGFLNMLTAARDARTRRFVYAVSSSVYGDHPDLPKRENLIGRPLSPYAVAKYVNELYAQVYARCYRYDSIGLRYFNVFGARQDSQSSYAAVIPQWFAAMIQNRPLIIHGDGESSRDFCYIDNAVQANILAALCTNPAALNQVYNVALNARTSLNALFDLMRSLLITHFPHLQSFQARHGDFRAGDVRHSQADISKAQELLSYAPSHRIDEGLRACLPWFIDQQY